MRASQVGSCRQEETAVDVAFPQLPASHIYISLSVDKFAIGKIFFNHQDCDYEHKSHYCSIIHTPEQERMFYTYFLRPPYKYANTGERKNYIEIANEGGIDWNPPKNEDDILFGTLF